MKKVIIGAVLALIGTLNTSVVHIVASNNMVTSWSTPPGRFITTLKELGMVSTLVIGYSLLVLGVIIMGNEYFKKN